MQTVSLRICSDTRPSDRSDCDTRWPITAAASQDCADCGGQATCYDHRDYRKPLDVTPVCSRCNIRRGSAVYFDVDMKKAG